MRTLRTSHGPVAFAELGQGRPLLLLHANPGDHRDFDAVMRPLAEDHRVIAVDFPGHGESPPPDPPENASAALYADVVVEVADALALSSAVVIGNSVGGYSAVRLALARPERVSALVLVDSGGFTERGLVERAFCRVKGTEWFTRAFATRFAEWYVSVRNEHTRAILARTEAGRRMPSRVAVDAAVWRSFLDPRHDLREAARAVRVPTLLAWGKHDPVVALPSGERAARTIPGAELVTFDTGHMPFAEAPEAFLSAVRGFLARALAEKSAA
jgi:pimeloyl-ACP methyl ester carboxylesterase